MDKADIIASTILATLVIIVILSGAIWFGDKNGKDFLSGQEQFECNQWKDQAKKTPGFYITKWQNQQCLHYKITIEAPVQ